MLLSGFLDNFRRFSPECPCLKYDYNGSSFLNCRETKNMFLEDI